MLRGVTEMKVKDTVMKMVKNEYCELDKGQVFKVGQRGDLEEQCCVYGGDRDDDDDDDEGG
jgi:hypothetical protein